jgi:hypothetical protein
MIPVVRQQRPHTPIPSENTLAQSNLRHFKKRWNERYGQPVGVFVGTATTGIICAFFTWDAQKGDDELKLLWNVTPQDIADLSAFLFVGDMSGRYIARSSLAARCSTPRDAEG